MPNLPHLVLPRADHNLIRKKQRGFGSGYAKDAQSHGESLSAQLDQVLDAFHIRLPRGGIDPTLIVRVQLDASAAVDEQAWERSGLIPLSVDGNKTLVLFASDSDLTEFKNRLAQYRAGTPPEKKGPAYQQLFGSIASIGEVAPQDRIGRLLRTEGVANVDAIDRDRDYIVDVELWDFGDRQKNGARLEQIRTFIAERNGRVTDDYVGESMVLLRCRVRGDLLADLLGTDVVALVDSPPSPAFSFAELLDVSLSDIAETPAPEDSAPSIAVIDSGLTAGHPLIAPALGEATSVPSASMDASDAHGHGTMVAGLALYGDVATCIEARSFVPKLRLYTARVLNAHNKFDEEKLITSQMRDAITYFRDTYGCRVFNLSLGDERLPYQGGKVSPWASILDTLARDLDILIVVSAGNYQHAIDTGESHDGHLQDYPNYLLHPLAKIIEPATGAIVLTVGALSHAIGVPTGSAGRSVAFQPIAALEQPSPFTRSGPGLGDAIKPELCELGGNLAYDGLTKRIRRVRELGVISTNRDYISNLFTADVGTSFAAPRVAHAAARLLESFPNATANLLRALLTASAAIPSAATEVLEPIAKDASLRVCGYGKPSLDLARSSDESRVVMYAESTLEHDKFHIFEVPIPEELISVNGLRTISVTLAFDPPVRHTRFDYLGVHMSFRLIRGKSAEEVAEAFRAREKSEERVDSLTSTRFDCPMEPGSRAREGGTLQRGIFSIRSLAHADYGDTYYLVVRCEKNWARPEHAPQRYAVVVVLQHTASVNIYQRVQQRLQERVRIRV